MYNKITNSEKTFSIIKHKKPGKNKNKQIITSCRAALLSSC